MVDDATDDAAEGDGDADDKADPKGGEGTEGGEHSFGLLLGDLSVAWACVIAGLGSAGNAGASVGVGSEGLVRDGVVASWVFGEGAFLLHGSIVGGGVGGFHSFLIKVEKLIIKGSLHY